MADGYERMIRRQQFLMILLLLAFALPLTALAGIAVMRRCNSLTEKILFEPAQNSFFCPMISVRIF